MKWWANVLIGLVLGAAIVWGVLTARDTAARTAAAQQVAAMQARQAADSVTLDASLAASAARDTALGVLQDSLRTAQRATAQRDSLLRQSQQAEAADKMVLSAAKTATDSLPILVATVQAADRRADQADALASQIATARDLLASDTVLLRAQVTASESRNRILAADVTRWRAVADSLTKTPPVPTAWRLFGLIPLPHLTAGVGATLATDGKLHEGAALELGYRLW